ncbi:MAG: GAF domain-containing protein [Crocinitomicaceae bacterium]
MAEELNIPQGNRKAVYESLLPQIKALISGESDFIANCANITAALKQALGFFWVGFYFIKNNEEMVLGPFQGEVACSRIKIGTGVCGKAWEIKKTIIVEDVDQFPGHIACSAASKSEIVVPIFKNEIVVAVLDVDSDQLSDFDETDKIYLEQLALILSELMKS